MDILLRQKMNKETMALNDTLVQINLIAIYRRFLMKTAEYTFFSSTYGIDHMLSYKISLSKFKKTEI